MALTKNQNFVAAKVSLLSQKIKIENDVVQALYGGSVALLLGEQHSVNGSSSATDLAG
jgi:hypothetical protein